MPSGITATDAAKLYEAIAAVNVATLKWSNPDEPTTCDLIQTALLNANEEGTGPDDGSGTGTDTGSGGNGSTDGGSGDNGSGDNDGSTDTGSGDTGSGDTGSGDTGSGDNGGSTDTGSSDNGSGDTGSSDNGSGDSGGSTDTGSGDNGSSGDPGSSGGDEGGADPSGTDSSTTDAAGDTTVLSLVVDDITLDDIKACGKAREELLLANAVLADYYQQLITTGTISDPDDSGDDSTTPTPSPSAPSRSGSTSSGSRNSGGGSSSATVSARAVASAEADVLRSQQSVDAAEAALANAELTAPISGTVGAISLEKGASSSGGSVTIVGEGTALVSIELPLATRALVSQGMAATVTPAGSTRSLDGTVSSIAILETSGTAGDNPTYTTTVAVSDPSLALKSGARAGVEIVTRTASGVVTVPASAVTPTGSGAGTVQVVDSVSSDTAKTVTVSTGAVGAGRVEITEGLAEGQIVVLSDRTASIDSLTTSSTNSSRRSVGFAIPR